MFTRDLFNMFIVKLYDLFHGVFELYDSLGISELIKVRYTITP